MRRQTAILLRILLVIIAGSPTVLLQAQNQPRVQRPQPKILNFQPTSETSAVVAVIGQVRNPAAYQFAQAPTLDLAIATAGGLTTAASPMIRIIRGPHAAHRVSYPNAAHEKLQLGDVIIIDVQPQRNGTPVLAADEDAVHLALLGVLDRPLVVKVHKSEAQIKFILQKLGQNPMPVQYIGPPDLSRESAPQLADGSVLVFDRRKIDVAGLPDDLPKILPCTLPEPEIGGYGAHHALEQRTRMEGMPPAWKRSPKPDAPIEVPPPAEVQDSVPMPRLQPDDQVAATFSSTERTGVGSPSVSTVPFSGSSTIAARPSRLTESAPSPATSAADVQEPAWNKLAPSDADQLLDDGAEIDDPNIAKASGAFTFWQMLSILASAALLVGVALAVRASQQKSKDKSQRTSTTKEHRNSTASAGRMRSEPRATIPTPHIPLEIFAAAVPAAVQPSVAESREIRQQRFMQLIKNELPLIEEPLALQPGLPLVTADEPKILLRRDDAAPADRQPHAPHIRTPNEQPAGQLTDRPHARFASGPHQRAGVESPVERALRQLQGGRS